MGTKISNDFWGIVIFGDRCSVCGKRVGIDSIKHMNDHIKKLRRSSQETKSK